MKLKPWYKVVTPREDLREGRPMDASEFAVHLDQVRDGRAPADYTDPERFFDRTYLTDNLTMLAAEAVKRLSGMKVVTSAVFNMTTQFGGGKTHALALLYHLAKAGNKATKWRGVNKILEIAGVESVPESAVAVFVGTEFDSLAGRGGEDGTPFRRTPWGEIAWQLGGYESFKAVERHDKEFIEPKGDVIRALLPKDKPSLILMDEIINYVSTYRASGYHDRMYNFIQSLSETARGTDKVVLMVSIPASELDYTASDQEDEQRFKKMLDRVGKAIILSVETDASEIIRRRLFEWGGLPPEARDTINEYTDWTQDHRQQIQGWFPVDNAKGAFEAAYPFHPSLISVFERKWQSLPRFQQTRGILRLLALWVSNAYREGYKGAHKDSLINLGTAPLEDPIFRVAVFEQLGETKLETAVTTDITGKRDANAVRLDKEASDVIKKARLHQKVATAIFFESNGGQAKEYATLPEIRLAVAEPDIDIGNIETVIEALAPPDGACYYLDAAKNRYWFSPKPNLIKMLTDRKAGIKEASIEERVKSEIQKVFAAGSGVERVPLPKKSSEIPDRAAVTLVIVPPENSLRDGNERERTLKLIEEMTKEHGTSARTFKSALIWAVAENPQHLRDEARKALAWEVLNDEQNDLRLDEGQKKQLEASLKRALRDVKETVWRTYNHIFLLAKDGQFKEISMGLTNSSMAESMVQLIVNRLRQDDEITEGISPNTLIKNWPPAFKEWSTKGVKDALYASPVFPRLLNPEMIKDTISKGVESGLLGYVGKTADGKYEPFYFNSSLTWTQIEISEDMYIIKKETALEYKESMKKPEDVPEPPKPPTGGEGPEPPKPPEPPTTGDEPPAEKITKVSWEGEVPAQKWMNFYTKILSKYATGGSLNVSIRFKAASDDGISLQKVEETKVGLQELGLDNDVQAE